MAIEKLTIRVEDSEDIKVLFNPNRITIQKTASWRSADAAQRDVPAAQFTHGEPATLSLELFFDTYESGHDVRNHTQKIYSLTTVENHGNLHRPPLCRLQWGTYDFEQFDWVLNNLNQNFTLFLENGTPVRATLNCTFRQWRSDRIEAQLQNTQSADLVKTRVVRLGESLSSIAGEEYRDPTLWRAIAEANRIDQPRILQSGQTLTVPPLQAPTTKKR
jgi:Uncharacterized protein containing LysM domain